MGVYERSLPRVVISTVMRIAQKGERHGSVYLVDLGAGTYERVFDWDRTDIDWSGRGGDRGLRGIAIHDGKVYIAASDEVLIFDRDFRLLGSYRNPYLASCHETFLQGDTLYLTSTGCDALLELDLKRGVFTRGWRLVPVGDHHREVRFKQWFLRFGKAVRLKSLRVEPFDPQAPGGPAVKRMEQKQDFHLNSVYGEGERLYFSGSKTNALLYLDGEGVYAYAKIPIGTHNARPYRKGVLLNDTPGRRTAYLTRGGRVLEHFPAVLEESQVFVNADLPEALARPKFTRGLATGADGLIVAGSSPATVAAFQHGYKEPLRYVSTTSDMREAVHGLEIWPF